MAGRFAQAKADGTYRPGTGGAPAGGQFVPAGMVAAASAFGAGSAPYGTPGSSLLYDAWGRPLPWDAFRSPIDGGPGVPIQPRFPDPRRSPREFEFNPGWNLVVTPRTESQMTRFAELRALADTCPYIRIAINHRKKQIRGMKWDISHRDAKTPSAKKEFATEIDRVKEFFEKPNRIDGLRFGEWIGQAIEEVLITDALTFFKAPTMDGNDLHSLVQIDGATIKLLIDEFAHVVGYQQIIYGYPTTQYRTEPVEQVIRSAEELDGRILYLVSNPAVDNVYGTAPVEEIRPIVDLAIRRIARQLSWYTDGTVPESFLESPADWDLETIKSAQEYSNSLNDYAERSQMRWLPAGTKYIPTKPYQYSKDEEEAIISAVCAHMGVSRSLFVAQVNRATAENDRNVSSDVGLKPNLQFFKDWIDDVIQGDLDAPDLEFTWVDEPSGSEKENAEALSLYVSSGILTVDEVRAEKGLDPIPESEKPKPPAAFGLPMAIGPDGKPIAPAAAAPGGPKAPRAKAPAEPPADEPAQKAELAAWERFARKRLEKGRHVAEFTIAALPKAVADFVVRDLKNARTDAEVRGVFGAAREELAKATASRKSYELEIKSKVHRMLDREKAQLLERVKAKLKPRAAA
jgi:hypothetical protein